MSSISKPAYCGVCEKAVSGRQQALECDRCRWWIHRLCGTGMSQKEYRDVARLVKDGGKFLWTCGRCSFSAASTSGVSAAVDAFGDFQEDELQIGQPVMESTRCTPAAAYTRWVSCFYLKSRAKSVISVLTHSHKFYTGNFISLWKFAHLLNFSWLYWQQSHL